jgi:hypothetical protein
MAKTPDACMSPKFPDISRFIPPPRKTEITVDAAEFTALRVIVMAVVADEANRNSASTGTDAQLWINDLSVRCQESILRAPFTGIEDREAGERFKTKVLEKINSILAGVLIAGDRNEPE